MAWAIPIAMARCRKPNNSTSTVEPAWINRRRTEEAAAAEEEGGGEIEGRSELDQSDGAENKEQHSPRVRAHACITLYDTCGSDRFQASVQVRVCVESIELRTGMLKSPFHLRPDAIICISRT
jgi:hypothetical protein